MIKNQFREKYIKNIQIIRKALKRFEKVSKLKLFFVAILITSIIIAMRFVTSEEFAFSALFLIPIVFATWYINISAGSFIAIVSIITWLVSDLYKINSFSSPYVPFINETLRFSVFIFIVFLISNLQESLIKAKKIALIDPLTKVFNRRGINILLELKMAEMINIFSAFSVAYIDFDNFKYINDQHGHQTGDELLINVARLLQDTLRDNDILARLGGDEFMIFMPEVEGDMAMGQLHNAVESLLALMKQYNWPVTCSVGVVTYNTPPSSVDEIFKQADESMYNVKKSGKNNINQIIIDKNSKSKLVDTELL